MKYYRNRKKGETMLGGGRKMRHNYTDKNWRVSYYDLPHDERHTPQDCMPHEDRFNNYDEAEVQFLKLKKSWQAHDVTFQIWDGDICINDVVSKKEWNEHWEEEAPKVWNEMRKQGLTD